MENQEIRYTEIGFIIFFAILIISSFFQYFDFYFWYFESHPSQIVYGYEVFFGYFYIYQFYIGYYFFIPAWIGMVLVAISIIYVHLIKIKRALIIGSIEVVLLGISFFSILITSLVEDGFNLRQGFYIGFVAWVLLCIVNIPLFKYRGAKKIIEREEELKLRELDLREREVEMKERELSGEVVSVPKPPMDLLIFISYATKDADLFRIKEIAERLTSYSQFKDVLYWQEDMEDNIIKYMNENLGKCDVVLLFCSPNALKSEPVEKEWTAADAMGKPIIPVFFKPDHIPPLLKSRLGVEFDNFDLQKNIDEMYSLILKKVRSK